MSLAIKPIVGYKAMKALGPITSVCAAIALLLVPFCSALADQVSSDAAETESILIDMVKNAPDSESRLRLLKAVVKSYPGESAIWAYEQIFQVYEETGQLDQALETGETILSLDCQDIEIAYKCLKIAGEKGDSALVHKWSQLAAGTAASVVSSPKDDETGRRRLEYAGQVRNNLGYLKYREIAGTPDAAKRLELLEDFLQRDKDSEYRHAAESLYLATCRESGNGRKASSAAEKILKLDESNEDALLFLAESYQDSQMDPQKLAAYANKLLVAINRKDRPAEIPDTEWTKRRGRLTGAARTG